MQRFFSGLLRHRVWIPVLFILLALAGLLSSAAVRINYDMADYLPGDAGTKQAINVAEREFDYPGTAQVMAKNVTMAQAAGFKERIRAVPGVKSVLWLDDVADIAQPEAFVPQDALDTYYRDGCACYYVSFDGGNYDNSTTQALSDIRALGADLAIAGSAETSSRMKNMLHSEMPRIIAIIIPICVVILMFASTSWLEPFLYLFAIGLSIALNMGTNVFFKNISFITNSMAAILQLAISMDYSIFLTHRYFEERDNGLDVRTAVVKASVSSLSSISASALTTVAGFAALLFMQYGIGVDMGLVLAKGVVLSFLTVMLLMPILIVLLHKALDRTRHRRFMPRFDGAGRAAVKLRYVIAALAVAVIVPSALAQGKTTLMYGDASLAVGKGQAYEERQEIAEKFGIDNTVMLMVPAGQPAKEAALCERLEHMPHVRQVTALCTITDNAISESFLPEDVVDNFRSEEYSRIIAYLDFYEEREECYALADEIRAAAQEHYPDAWYAAGWFTSLADIRGTVKQDSATVTILSIAAVGLIVLVAFRSLSIPFILLLVIQGSIWINMSIPYFTGLKMAYIGYLIISALQLGATIDYGILLAGRYREFRRTLPKKEAAVQAVKTAGPSILTSALILAAAGFGYGFLSQVDSIAELGMLIGRGAMISAGMTILLLPALLVVFDKIIQKTTLIKKKGETHENQSAGRSPLPAVPVHGNGQGGRTNANE